MNLWLDGFSALGNRAWAAFGILLMIVWGQVVIRKTLDKAFKGQLKAAESLSLGMAGWIAPLALWAGWYLAAVFLFGTIAGQIISFLLILSILPPVFTAPKTTRQISLPEISLLSFAAISLLLRFAFLQKAVLPSYFDSAEHYRIIKGFLETMQISTANYYHTGYHVLSAAVSQLFQLKISDAMLLFGQVALSVLPLSLFFIVRRETNSDAAGWFACLLAGFGWHMPSHAVNWGKYPALLSLVCVHFVLSLGYLLARTPGKDRRPGMYLLIGAGILLSLLIHTRTLFVYAGATAAALLATQGKRLPVNLRRIGFGLAISILAVEVAAMQADFTLAPLLRGYSQNDAWMLAFVLALTPFAIKYHAGVVFILAASLDLLLAALFIPVNAPGYGMLTLLDRPYAQMLTYLPLSLMGGLGLAGLIQWMRRLFPRPSLRARLTLFSAFGFVVLNASLHHDFYPSDCCQFASRDDLAAITWMDTSLPTHANILIASENLLVTSFQQSGARAPADGGIWITPLIGRPTLPAWQVLDFTQREVHEGLCARRLDYVYVGRMPQSFDAAQLDAQPQWYRRVFALPAASIYEVTGCEQARADLDFMVKVEI
jgi:hypothetical protein